jgi:putative inorganic carbon (hco3(-)) transporter
MSDEENKPPEQRSSDASAGAPDARLRQARPEAAAPPTTPISDRTQFILVALILSIAAGLAVVRIDSQIVIGLLASAIFGITVLLWPYAGLLAYMCLFLLRPGELFPGLNPLHLERIVGAIALLSMFVQQYRRQGRIFVDGTRQTRLLFLLLAAAFLSVPFSYWRRGALEGCIDLMKNIAFYLLVAHLILTSKRLRTFVHVYGILIAYLAISSYTSYKSGASFYAQGIDRAVASTSVGNNPNELGTTMAATVPLFLLQALRRRFHVSRLLYAGAAVMATITMVLTGSRASLLGFLGGMVYLWWTSKKRILLGGLGIAVLVAGFIILPEQYKTRYATITQQELDGSSQSRVTTWLTGLEMLIDRPLTGVGIRCFGAAHGLGYSPEGRPNWLASHSLYIQVLAELGLIGSVIFFALLIEFLAFNRRTAAALQRDGPGEWEYEKVVLKALLAGFVVLLISGVFGHSLLRGTWYIYAALGLSVFRMSRNASRASQVPAILPPGSCSA